jgi:uncharacterized protein YndB with AHSA1/START domain
MTPVHHAEFTIERRYASTPAQTFSAFADPGLRKQWFANPGDWPDGEWELDFRVGGSESNGGTSTRSGMHHQFRCRFHEIVDDERIVYAYDLLIDHRLISVSLATIELFADGTGTDTGTRLLFTEQGAFLRHPDDAAEREHGTGILLDLLDGFLAGQVAR